MEEEAEKLKEMQSEVEKQMNLSSSSLGEYSLDGMNLLKSDCLK
jgi:polyadenylate-binding protein 2